MLQESLKILMEIGISKEAIASRAGVHRKTIYNIINGVVPTPAVEKVIREAIDEIKELIAKV